MQLARAVTGSVPCLRMPPELYATMLFTRVGIEPGDIQIAPPTPVAEFAAIVLLINKDEPRLVTTMSKPSPPLRKRLIRFQSLVGWEAALRSEERRVGK